MRDVTSTENDLLPTEDRRVLRQSSDLEWTTTAVVLGITLSVLMASANVYLGLKAGMTVSASIPAAVVAMGILSGFCNRRSIYEANLVQTAASAGESLAAGIIFTMPALILLGIWKSFDFWTTSLIALTGGLLGILFMIPMRRVFIVNNKQLRYPEALACVAVLRAGSAQVRNASQSLSDTAWVVIATGLGALFKCMQGLVGLFRGAVASAMIRNDRVFYLGSELSPALAAVGIIIGLNISFQLFLGGAIGWFIALPSFSYSSLLDTELVKASMSAEEVAGTVWSKQIRYIGVGTMLVGGAISIWSVRAGIWEAILEMRQQFRPNHAATAEANVPITEQNISGRLILLLLITSVALTAGVYYFVLEKVIGLTLIATLAMFFLAFFFTAVASYIVGLVGNSNSPVSGMTITAVLITASLVYAVSYTGPSAMLATLGVAGIVCCAACTAGDVCNDLKTGAVIGASPKSQQLMQILGVAVAAFILAPVMTILHEGSIRKAKASSSSNVTILIESNETLSKAETNSEQPDAVTNSNSAPTAPAQVDNKSATQTETTTAKQSSTTAEGEIQAGIGSKDFPAPQAQLMKALVSGFFGNQPLPWRMVFIGINIGLGFALLNLILYWYGFTYRFYIMPIAVGIYLPLEVAIPILLGGIVTALLKWMTHQPTLVSESQTAKESPGTGDISKEPEQRLESPAETPAGTAPTVSTLPKESVAEPLALQRAILIASGLIAGESLFGVYLGLWNYRGWPTLDLAVWLKMETLAGYFTLASLIGLLIWILFVSLSAHQKESSADNELSR